MAWPNWLEENWFSLLESASIVAGLFYTAHSLREDTKAKKIANLISLTEKHRALWTQFYERPQLARILDLNADLEEKPVTAEEKLFVNLVIVHFTTTCEAMDSGMIPEIQGIEDDVRSFFSLPIPSSIWEKSFQSNNKFIMKLINNDLK